MLRENVMQSIRHAAVLLTLLAAVAAAPAQQGFLFTDFTVVSDFSFNGSATQSATNTLELTPLVNWNAGSIWHTTQQAVVGGFDTIFNFRVTPQAGGGHADGFAFLIQNDPVGTGSLATTAGGDLGYSGLGVISNCLAIEIDNWQNGGLADTSNNEISVHTNGVGNNSANEAFSLGQVTPAINFTDGAIHTCRIEYIPGTLNIYLDNLVVPELSVPYDFTTGGTYVSGSSAPGMSLNGGFGWLGFTGATGGGNQIVDIIDWQFTSSPGADPCFAGTVGAGVGGPFDVLRVNGSTGDYFRTVSTFTYDPITISVDQPTTNPMPADFLIFGLVGPPDPNFNFGTPFGTICFPVDSFFHLPWTFVLADTLQMNSDAILPSAPAPWTTVLPFGIPFPATVVLQGFIVEDSTVFTGVSVTNGVVIDSSSGPPPTITSVSPSSAAPGATISIMGTGFRTGIEVTLGGLPIPPSSVTPTQIDFVLTNTFACDASLMVTNLDGQTATGTYNPTPTVLNAVFASGPAAGGNLFIVSGIGFAPGTTVTIGGAAATVNNATATVLNLTTPPGVIGVANVVVTTPGGCSATTSYTYL